mmetsp:Transcript_13978/g.37755  ORF Transcript_13978/g.37755 Transcript_13978/m.37755 type:complete len:314 (-) Transcript_13978:1014-1955(-)|eukprot:CAMPEP_0202341112 /NCGR_PEP_ID=MMETSP1126-20121109/2256_1 /ASSEMBLY_ACC=CAM_ASM_000457 /TAXON_ID=3047 /ORGANISM="Dunaliella tertiolecta, Strain CCMP1320" /LENGTH=313 /DNA_ID=CAMNT_0048931901 /DNA_START=105 /DNA_END=1046 /DNA_ORIENTATION=-
MGFAKTWDEDGVCTVHVVSAQGLPKKGLGKQDPYLKVELNGQSLKSNVSKGGGSDPVWNLKFHFSKKGVYGCPEITVYDKTFPKDIKLGVARVPFDFALPDQNEEMTVPLMDPKSDDRTGSLTLTMSLTPFHDAAGIQLPRLPYIEPAFPARQAAAYGAPYGAPPPYGAPGAYPPPGHPPPNGYPPISGHPPPPAGYPPPSGYPPPYRPPPPYGGQGSPPPYGGYGPPPPYGGYGGYPPPYGYPPQGPPNVVVVPNQRRRGRGYGGGYGGGMGGMGAGLGLGLLGGGLLGYGLGGGFDNDCGDCDGGDGGGGE